MLGSGYELRVMVHAYRNPTGTCHDCFFSETQTEPGCCDRHSETVNCDANPGDRCDNFIIFCQRALGTPADNITCPPFPVGQEQVSSHMDNSDDVMFADEVFGLDNPMLFIGSSWQVIVSIAVTLYMALICVLLLSGYAGFRGSDGS